MEDEKRIIKENLERLDKKRISVEKRRRAFLYELAETVCGENGSLSEPEDMISRYAEIKELSDLSVTDTAEITRIAAELLGADKLEMSEATLLLSSEGEEELFDENAVSVVRGNASEEAMRKFLFFLPGIAPRYGSGHREVCESVFYSRTPFCVLPVSNERDGRLEGFCSMIRKYDLKIVMMTSSETPEQGKTEFALLKKNAELIPSVKGEREYGFSFIVPGSAEETAKIVLSARLFGVEAERIDSVPSEHSEGEFDHEIRCRLKKGASIGGFLTYLTLESPQYLPIGLYQII